MNTSSIIIALALVASAIIANASEEKLYREREHYRRPYEGIHEGHYRGRGRTGGRGGLESKVENKLVEHKLENEVGKLVRDQEHKREEGLLGAGHLGHHDEVFEGPLLHRGSHPHLRELEAFNDIVLLEELRRRGHHGLLRHGAGIEEGLGQPLTRRGIRRGGLVGPIGGAGLGAIGGAGALGGAGGAIGGIENVEANAGALGSVNHNNQHNSIQGGKSGSAAGSNHIEVDHHRNNHDDIEGASKHQVIDQDQLIVKNKISGINDSKGFRNSRGNSEDDHFGSGSTHHLRNEEHGRIGQDSENDQGFGAINGRFSQTGAAGAVGAAGLASGLGGAGGAGAFL